MKAARRRGLLRGAPPTTNSKHANLDLPLDRIATGTGGYLSVVTIVRDEAPDIREWVEFQRLIGIEHVYIYDDGSTDGTQVVLSTFVDQGFVTLIPWSKFLKATGQQYLAYAHAITTFGASWRWIAFLDRDEYLFPVANESLAVTLSRYEDLPAVVVPWHIFGFNGHERRPSGLVIENYTERLHFPPPAQPEALRQWKSIVDPSAVHGIATCHFFRLAEAQVGGYTEDRVWVSTIPGGWDHLSTDVFRLNHYFTQSREDFVRRRSTHRDPAAALESDRNWKRVQAMKLAIEDAEPVHDELIIRYVTQLRKNMAATDEVPGSPAISRPLEAANRHMTRSALTVLRQF